MFAPPKAPDQRQLDAMFGTIDYRIGMFGAPVEDAEREAGPGPKVVTLDEHYSYQRAATAALAILCGRRGIGKSAGAALLSYILKQLSIETAGIPERPVYSNMKMTFADYTHPEIYSEVQQIEGGGDPWADSINTWDEISQIVPSVRPGSRATLSIGNSLTMMRKRRMDIVSTGQFPQRIGSTVMEQCDFLIAPRLRTMRAVLPGMTEPRTFTRMDTYWWNWSGSLTDRSWVGAMWPQPLETADMHRAYFPIDFIFGLYDTNALVANPHTDIGQLIIASMIAEGENVTLLDVGGDGGSLTDADYAEYQRIADEWFAGSRSMSWDDFLRTIESYWDIEPDAHIEGIAEACLLYMRLRVTGAGERRIVVRRDD